MSSDQSNPKDPLSRIAHKIRTPLTVVRSTTHNLLDGAFGKVSGEQAEWLRKMEKHTQNLEALVNEILKFLREGPGESARSVDDHLEKVQKEGAPAVHAASPGDSASPALRGASGPPRILVVDDEPDVLDVIKEGMEMKGYQITAFADGREALDFAVNNPIDLVLMDVHLRHSNGVELTRELKNRKDSFIPVILVTGQNDFRQKEVQEDHGADDMLMKPFFMEELFSRVSSMLRFKKTYDELQQMKKKGVR